MFREKYKKEIVIIFLWKNVCLLTDHGIPGMSHDDFFLSPSVWMRQMKCGLVLPRVFAEMRGGVDGYKIRRLNNETPRYAGTCAKNEGGHGSRGGTKTSRDAVTFRRASTRPRDRPQFRSILRNCAISPRDNYLIEITTSYFVQFRRGRRTGADVIKIRVRLTVAFANSLGRKARNLREYVVAE